MPPRKRLGQLLTELGVIDDHQLQSALGHQRQWGGKLGAVLVQKGFCGEEQLVSALAQHLNMERVKLAEAKIDPRAVKFVSRQIAEKLHVFPYEVNGAGRSEVISIAMSDPTDLSAVDQLAFHTGKRIKPMLAADSEIVVAIQTHYGPAEEKKEATDKVARPGPQAQAAQAPHPQPAPAASAPAGFPRRIEPQAAPAAVAAGAAARPASPAPAAAARPAPAPSPAAPKAAAAGPVGTSQPAPPPPLAAAAAPQAAPVPVDLPEDDADDLGLEPIAAHSQFGGEVAGKEDVAGEGAATDAIEGLVSASLAHQTSEQGDAAASASWGLPADAQAPADPGWGTPVQATGEGWGAPAAEPVAAWPAEPSADGWSMAEPSTNAGWSAPEGGQAWAEVPGPPDEPPSEALPTDAILGALEATPESGEQGAGDSWGAEEASPEAKADADRPATPGEPAVPAPQGEPSSSWTGSEPSAAAPAQAPAEASEPPQIPPSEIEALGIAALAAAAEDEQRDASPQPAAAPEEEASAASFARPDTQPIEAPSSSAAGAHDHEAEAPDAWAASEDPLAADSAPSAAGEEPPPAHDDASSTQEFAAPSLEAQGPEQRAAEEEGESVEVDTASFEATDAAGAGQASQPEATWEAERQEGGLGLGETPQSTPETTERFAAQPEIEAQEWSARGPDTEPQHPHWMPEGLSGAVPLSPADLGTLASIGIEPGDEVGALRLLAALVRILNRNQLIEPDELRAEIHESCAAGATAASAAPSNGTESEASAASPADPATSPAET